MKKADYGVKNILISEEQIRERIKEMGREMTELYKNSENKLLVITLLKGGAVFTSDFIRNIDLQLRVEFIKASSYKGTESTGTVKIDLPESLNNLEGYDVLISEDIADTGVTLAKVEDILLSRNPASLKSAVLLNKPSRRRSPFVPDYVGFEIPDLFVVGFGLDYCEKYRNLPYIAEMDENYINEE